MLELVNSSTQTILTGGTLNLGSVNIRQCDCVAYNGTNTIEFKRNGIYQVFVKVDATASVADQLVSVALAYNNTVSQIASAKANLVNADDVISLTIPKMIKICNAPLTLTVVNSGADTTDYSNIIVDIVK
jgi:hypothetical protein